MIDVNIRVAREDDVSAIEQMLFELHHEHYLREPEQFKAAIDIEPDKSMLTYLSEPQSLIFVAEKEGELIGFISGYFQILDSSIGKSVQMGSVDHYYVMPLHRQQQVGAMLMETLETRFKQYGVEQVFVEVWHSNQGARTSYKKMGFNPHIHYLRKAL